MSDRPSMTLHLGDCLDVLGSLPDASVDAVITDPPYGQTNEAYESDIAFRPELWAECARVAKPNAAIVSFAGSPTYHRIASAIEAGGWKVRQMWGWVYRDGLITSAWPKEGFDRLAPAIDPICYATRGKMLLRLAREGDNEWHRNPASRGVMNYSARASSHGRDRAKGHWPRTLVAADGHGHFEFFALSRTAAGRDENVGHPNQKPLALMRWLVGKLPPGSVVLDPFAGSGSTLVAAISEGMNAIGIERDPEYHAIAQRRINELWLGLDGLHRRLDVRCRAEVGQLASAAPQGIAPPAATVQPVADSARAVRAAGLQPRLTFDRVTPPTSRPSAVVMLCVT